MKLEEFYGLIFPAHNGYQFSSLSQLSRSMFSIRYVKMPTFKGKVQKYAPKAVVF